MVGEGLTRYVTEGGKKVSIKQKLYTGFLVVNREKVFSWLHEVGRPDAIKTDVNKSTLRTIVRTYMEEGNHEIPEYITLHFENKIEIRDEHNKSLRNPREEKE